MSTILEYNPDQLAAIKHPHAPLMILAGPGTGKTATLVGRIAHLIKVGDTSAEQILALTFTERAAAELKARIAQAVESESIGKALSATTFHAFCYQVVLEFQPEYRDRILLTEGDALFLLQEHYAELPRLNSATFRREPIQTIKACHRFFSRLSDELISPTELPGLLSESVAAFTKLENEGKAKDEDLEHLNQLRDLCAIYPLYNQWKETEGFIDYGDMIIGCWDILNDPAHLKVLQERYRTVIVDEFQDNNYALNLVVDKLVAQHSSITVVGDEDQCIYSFRGASPANFIGFEARHGTHPEFAKIILQTNYRSTQPIIDLATEIISHNSERTEKIFTSARGAGPLPEIIIAETKAHAPILAHYIAELHAAGDPLDEMAVLVRTARQARETVAALTAVDILSTFIDIDYFQLPSIRTILAWCALVGRTDSAGLAAWRVLTSVLRREPSTDELHWLLAGLQLPQRHQPDPDFQPDDQVLLKLARQLTVLTEKAQTAPAHNMVWDCLVVSRLLRRHWTSDYYSDRLALINLYRCISIAQDFTRTHPKATINRWSHYMTVMQSTGSIAAETPTVGAADSMVQVLTVHKAKGLEFDHVFLGKLAAGSFPTNYRKPATVTTPPAHWSRDHKALPDDPKLAYYAEELRIFYVALTRARQRITMLVPEKRKSRLVKDLPQTLIRERNDMAAPEAHETSPVEQLIVRLKTNLNREIAAGRFDQSREIINAIELAVQHLKGIDPDTTGNAFQQQLEAAFSEPTDETIPPGGLVRLSASRMNDFERCSLMYRYMHQERIPSRADSKPALAFGNLIHRVLEEYHSTEDTGQASFAEILDRHWKPEEFASSQQADQYYADAVAVLEQYQSYLAARQYTPSTLAVEHQFEFRLGDALINGRIDHIYTSPGGGINLIDYKTSKSKVSQKEAERQLQLALYAIYCEQARDVTLKGVPLGRLPEAVTFFFVRDPDPEVRIQYSHDKLLLHRERIADITSAIRQARFEPTNDDRICMYCDYKELICPKWETGD